MLHWKRVNQRWQYNALIMTFKCLTGTVPEYLINFDDLIDSYYNLNTRSKAKKHFNHAKMEK